MTQLDLFQNQTTQKISESLETAIIGISEGDTAKESETNAIAGFENAGHSADELISITTVELDA